MTGIPGRYYSLTSTSFAGGGEGNDPDVEVFCACILLKPKTVQGFQYFNGRAI